MSEALASSSATLQPGQQRMRARARPVPRPIQLGTRYLGLLSAWAVAIGLTFKSVLLALFFLILQSADLPNVVKFSAIFVVALLSGYRSFRFATKREGLALLSAFLTAGTVTFGAFGMVTYLNQGSQYVAVILAFAWYAWQGLTVHALDDSLTRRIMFEYGLFAVICVYLIALALVTGRPIG